MLNWAWIRTRKDGSGPRSRLINLGVWKTCSGWLIIRMSIPERNSRRKPVSPRLVYRLVVLTRNNPRENHCSWPALSAWFECKWSELYTSYHPYFYNYVYKVSGLRAFMNAFWWSLSSLFYLNCRVNLSFNFTRFGFKIEEQNGENMRS